jgi:hypothetical protein
MHNRARGPRLNPSFPPNESQAAYEIAEARDGDRDINVKRYVTNVRPASATLSLRKIHHQRNTKGPHNWEQER